MMALRLAVVSYEATVDVIKPGGLVRLRQLLLQITLMPMDEDRADSVEQDVGDLFCSNCLDSVLMGTGIGDRSYCAGNS